MGYVLGHEKCDECEYRLTSGSLLMEEKKGKTQTIK